MSRGRREYGVPDPRYYGPDGALRDFQHTLGDPSRPGGEKPHAQLWGRSRLYSIQGPGQGLTDRATMIDVRDLGRTHAINVRFRFATVDAQGNPVLPFSPIWPFLGGPEALTLLVRKGVNYGSAVNQETFVLQSFGSAVGDVLPFDTVEARVLGIDAEFSNGGSGAEQVYVESIATIVSDIGTRDKITGWPVVSLMGAGGFLAAVASPGFSQLLRPHAQRSQFFIVNTSTNADLILAFGDDVNANWGPPPTGTIVLPKNTFATYESPVGGWRGRVTGSWNNGAPDGGALVTEGTYY